jgi:hypothetical protein
MLHGFFARARFYAPDGGSAAGGTTSGGAQTGGEPGSSTSSAPATGQAPAPASGATPAAPPAPAPAAAPAGDKPAGDKSFSQADVDRMVTERLAEEKRRAEQRTADATKKSKEEALKQAGEWQALAEQRSQELGTLQGAAEQRDAYAKALNGIIHDQIADWPDEVKALDPGKDNLEARIAWVKSAKPLADRLRQAPKAPDTEGGAGNRRPPETPAGGEAGKSQSYRFTTPGDVTW